MKKCSRCGKQKESKDFYKDKRTCDGLYSSCKKCCLSLYPFQKKYSYREKLIVNPNFKTAAKYAFHCILVRLSGREIYKNVKLLFSLEELIEFYRKNWDIYWKIYKIWKKSNYQRRYFPSIDRVNSKGHYALDNIAIIPQAINSGKDNKIKN